MQYLGVPRSSVPSGDSSLSNLDNSKRFRAKNCTDTHPFYAAILFGVTNKKTVFTSFDPHFLLHDVLSWWRCFPRYSSHTLKITAEQSNYIVLIFLERSSECPKIYRKSVLHLLKYRFAVYLSSYSTALYTFSVVTTVYSLINCINLSSIAMYRKLYKVQNIWNDECYIADFPLIFLSVYVFVCLFVSLFV